MSSCVLATLTVFQDYDDLEQLPKIDVELVKLIREGDVDKVGSYNDAVLACLLVSVANNEYTPLFECLKMNI